VKFSLKTKATALVTAVVFVVFGTMGYIRHERLATELLPVQSEQQAALPRPWRPISPTSSKATSPSSSSRPDLSRPA
jgi:hypothetical protein